MAGNSLIRFETTHGAYTVELYPHEAPVTVENFLAYVDAEFFDGTIFHRIVPGFVIQGGELDELLDALAHEHQAELLAEIEA